MTFNLKKKVTFSYTNRIEIMNKINNKYKDVLVFKELDESISADLIFSFIIVVVIIV